MEGNAVNNDREGRIGEYLKRIAGLQVVLASSGSVPKLPWRNNIVAKRIVHPLGNFVAYRCNVRHVASKDACSYPARPGKGLDQLRLPARAGIECGMEAKCAALSNIGPGRQKYVVRKSDGQGIHFQMLQLNDGVELGDEEAGIDNCKYLMGGAAAEKICGPFGHIDGHGRQHAGRTHQRVPVYFHGLEKLGALDGIAKLRKARTVVSAAKVRRVPELVNKGGNVKSDRIALIIGKPFKEHGDGNKLGLPPDAPAAFWSSSYHCERKILPLKAKRFSKGGHRRDPVLLLCLLGRLRHRHRGLLRFNSKFRFCALALHKIVIDIDRLPNGLLWLRCRGLRPTSDRNE